MEDQVACSRCRTRNDAGASFCSSCGAAITVDTGAGAGAASPSGWALATAGMAQPPALPGERRDEFEYAGWWRRFFGWLLDGIMLFASFIALSFIFGAILGVTDPEHWLIAPTSSEDAELAEAMFALLYLCMMLVWEVAWIASPARGKPGQRILGYVVVKPDGSRVGVANAVGRIASKLLLFTLPLVNIVLLIMTAVRIGTSDRRQALHDTMAGTVCVVSRSAPSSSSRRTAIEGMSSTPPPSPPSTATSSGPFV